LDFTFTGHFLSKLPGSFFRNHLPKTDLATSSTATATMAAGNDSYGDAAGDDSQSEVCLLF